MALNVSYVQQYYQGIDAQSLKSATRNILANAEAKATANQVKGVDVDLYNGQIDAMTARQVAMSGAGLQVTLNHNLETAIKFLKTKAAESTKSSKTADVISIASTDKDKEGSNPFYNGDVYDYSKKEEEKKEYLFINVA
ncbi:MAG: hypothetical protein DKM23_02600 [Candidatus Melainabacteria bacterium]|nr:MAG: hypothetical protein DKM24_06360 [Candidatus Melainabacteria bacterium]RAI12409.1 MAG: hypothetical protein DKM23_02600 [Candidatus Melainabacteria bacterium]